MPDTTAVITQIREAFAANPYPGDPWLVGSREGCEPEEEVGPFRGRADWQMLTADFLDQHAGALHFFSEAGLRFFLPAFLIADLTEGLVYADPVFTLTHGFHDTTVPMHVGGRTFTIRSGSSAFVNPLRYGAMTFLDHARSRLSIFTREEAAAIVTYLESRIAQDEDNIRTPHIEAALKAFWFDRARSAPTAADLRRHLDEQAAWLKAVSDNQP